ncbi:SDR family oxidoreductase [Maribacter algarum]|uniref:SDR family oxidoreductase n=1 Tax=Maribacter algarum (ex Zhang et al. 2020) TaxID=2578118 RepID=A0A5S3PUA8_9FLAO|nr:SDR family oxidoreductase [Maribacter algarum]TMM58553.1 SDR family oxidoreductase [Maribacter algarum]
MNRRVGVLGCGWLGFPLAISLVQDGYEAHGSTTSEEKLAQLKKEGIAPFIISLRQKKINGDVSGFLQDVGVLIVNVPPKLRGQNKENYVKKMQLLHTEVKKSSIQKIVFVSSTSVYGDVDGDVTEETIPQPSSESGKQLLAAENIFRNDKDIDTTIVRFGGLIGPNRHPITKLSGRQNLSNGNHPINLIHLNDCIRIIKSVLTNSWWNEVLNGVYPEHLSKQRYYSSEAKKKGLQVPDYKVNNTKKGKKVHSKVLINVKKFDFTTTL